MKRFLHVGCGPKHKDQTTPGFAGADWTEVRLDIDPSCNPDIVGTLLDMKDVADGSMDAVFSSHNIEHVYPHEVPTVLAEFRRVLAPDGFAVITCPDLKSVARLIADDKLTEPAYHTAAGVPIAPLDILYGWGRAIASGNVYMAHHGGFTLKSLMQAVARAGFGGCFGLARPANFDLWVLATKRQMSDEDGRALAAEHFPMGRPSPVAAAKAS